MHMTSMDSCGHIWWMMELPITYHQVKAILRLKQQGTANQFEMLLEESLSISTL